MDYVAGSGHQETRRRLGGALLRDPAGETERLFRRAWLGILPLAGQNRAGPAERVLPVAVKLGHPKQLRLHEDQRPNDQHAR
jgi:hypothetical protein